MPTLPSQPHQHRQVAESFGADPERYDRTRPRYPEALVQRIARPGLEIVDVGCGTGIAARLFQAAGCQVLGVEPDERMAGWARRTGIEVEISTFEAWDHTGRSFDAVIAGQTWHWVDPVAGAAKAAEVLRPGGRLTVFWNAAQPPPELENAFAEVYRKALPDVAAANPPADPYSIMCDLAADGIRQAQTFGDPQRWRFDWDKIYTRDEWLDQMPTQGGLTLFPQAKRDELLAGVGAAIDEAGGSFTMHYATVAVSAAKS
ncbi:SAM-dependent methyltransferase [Kibdelosporangium banguiense]|uniref:SAM-dependent methyltransferase n=1 Tax=Kibdelosporangium banguiense TaxID=1365924 RepID=A0ABS4TA64_9PSEU|nr:class I SAM-dependent methyltransferase [Kibdelosporangium banguiense]MBP2321315.1 SAM-dependent methyltransferase [Kibdelosporangium banguiense]